MTREAKRLRAYFTEARQIVAEEFPGKIHDAALMVDVVGKLMALRGKA